MDNETLLFDRIEMIKLVINKYGEENFYISFSGGKDSTVLHYLVDEALPNNKIPRVFCNTGIEYVDIVKFVKQMAAKDDRFIVLQPNMNIKETLERDGYPFKSKEHSQILRSYQETGIKHYVTRYLDGSRNRFKCPKILKYQFTDKFKLKVSELCCKRFKKEPFEQYSKQSGRIYSMTGVMSGELGARESIKNCIVTDRKGNLKKFHPLLKVNKEFEDWYIEQRHIELCKLYYPPFNFERTGCKGCPFAIKLKEQLDVMEELLPAERKQCEYIWKPVYDEYRRIGYRKMNKGKVKHE